MLAPVTAAAGAIGTTEGTITTAVAAAAKTLEKCRTGDSDKLGAPVFFGAFVCTEVQSSDRKTALLAFGLFLLLRPAFESLQRPF